jgi:hypothetical protein
MKIIYNINKLLIINIILLAYVNSQQKITELQKIKGRVCLTMQSRKYQEEKEPMTNWIEHLSKDLNVEPKHILFICLSMCYKLIPDNLARKIHKDLGNFDIDRNDAEFAKIYDYEFYNYDNIDFINKATKEFQPVFDIIKDEVRKQGRDFFENFQFEMTPLLKFFLFYFLVNTIIIFYKRIKNPPIIIKLSGNEKDKESVKNNDKENSGNKKKKKKEKNN